MALNSSGKISISDICGEKKITELTNISLTTLSTTNINSLSSSKPNGIAPHNITKFYNYNHTAVSSGGGTGTVNTGVIWNNTGHTISATYMAIKANGTNVAYITLPTLANGDSFKFSTSYTNLIFYNGTFVVDLYTPTVGLNSSNYFYMTAGSNSTNGYFSNTGSSLRGTVTSSGPQYTIIIYIK
ncbi:hypothetical protein [Flavobacterium sp.]|uniref:hypothetical protein n=1 Tax=Flavobacterium sp. TaxID=239 RepID=UPI003D0DD953